MRLKRNELLLKSLLTGILVTISLIYTGCSSKDSSSGIITLDGQKVKVRVDTKTCRWSAELKGTDVKLKDIHFLDGDNPSGWKITATLNRKDEGVLGNFETVILHGTKKGQLDFDYHISAGKTGNDIIVSLDRIELPSGLTAETAVKGNLLTVDYMTITDKDVDWKIYFRK
jgi:hypothetical protein